MSDLTFDQMIEAPVAAVYHALTNEAALEQWLCNTAHASAREGGPLYFLWAQPDYYAVGNFTELSPDESLAFTWLGKGEPGPTEVHIRLSEVGGRTELRLTHGGVGEGEAWQETRDQIRRGWEYSLLNLKQVLETGLDKRIYDRPFLGIYIAGQVSAEEAAEAGLPVEGGIRINGTVPGTGAEAAGLDDQDILVAIGGQAVPDFASLQVALRGYKAGDATPIVYFRGGQRQEAEMTFSRRPEPDVPGDPVDLAERLGQVYRALDEQLIQLTGDLEEELAVYRPSPEKWSAKEILGHLLTSERGLQMSIASNVDARELRGQPNNPDAWISAAADTYTLAELVDGLKRAEEETVALIARLPAEMVARKATYLAVGNNVLNAFPGHTRGHYAEMQAAIEAARAALAEG